MLLQTSDQLMIQLLTPPNVENIPSTGLQAAPPLKKLVLTGVCLHTTAEEVKEHIMLKCDRDVTVSVKKMKLNPEYDHSSFIIFPGRNTNLCSILLEQNFWPENITIREFDENFRTNKANYKKIKQGHRKQD